MSTSVSAEPQDREHRAGRRALTIDEKFAMVPRWVAQHPNVTDRAVRLYVQLALHADAHTRSSFPSRATLAREMGGCSVDSVDRATRVLVDIGALKVENRRVPMQRPDGAKSWRYTSNLYVLTTVDSRRYQAVSKDGASGRSEAAPSRVAGRAAAARGSRAPAAMELNPSGTRLSYPKRHSHPLRGDCAAAMSSFDDQKLNHALDLYGEDAVKRAAAPVNNRAAYERSAIDELMTLYGDEVRTLVEDDRLDDEQLRDALYLVSRGVSAYNATNDRQVATDCVEVSR